RANSSAFSPTRMASGKRWPARRVSSLSSRICQSFSSPFTLPAFTQLANEPGSQLLRRQRQCLPLIGDNIGPDEKARGAGDFGRRREHLAVPIDQRITDAQSEIEFRGREHIAADGTGRRAANAVNLRF